MRQLQTIAAVSDIHGNLDALKAVLADIERESPQVELIVNCGDTVSGPLAAARTARLLMAHGMPMIAGNHERQLLTQAIERMGPSDACAAAEIDAAQRDWLAAAPPSRWLADDVFVCHGTPDSDVQYWLETVTDDFGQNGSPGVRAATGAEAQARLGAGPHAERATLIVCGHTHMPRTMSVRSPSDGHEIVVVNPGSVGLPAYDDGHPHWHHMETGSPHARYALMRRQPAGWGVQLRAVAYDPEAMARLAEERQRPDWAVALRTGRMRPNA
jgi:predicted phosphodiesterase